MLCQPNYWQYTMRGEEAETWSPQFTYSGYQYLEVTERFPRDMIILATCRSSNR